MASFKDKAGREWAVELTVGDLKALRQEVGIEFTVGGGKSLYDQIGELAGDVEKVGRAVWLLIREQAAERGVTVEGFEKSLNRDTVRASALALVDAFVDFYHPRTAAEAMKTAVRGRMETAEEAAGRKLAELLASPSNGSAGSTPA